MNTFILDANLRLSAHYLDNTRLHKQAVEIMQILTALNNPQPQGWQNHPAVVQWRHHQPHLAAYGVECVLEWQDRGYQSTLLPFFNKYPTSPDQTFPPAFHKLIHFHRSYMFSKNFAHYKPLFPEVTYIHQYSTYLDPTADYIPFQVIRKQRHYVRP